MGKLWHDCRQRISKLDNMPTVFPEMRSINGFTLLEVMVALVLGILIVGGVMGLISISLQYSQRVKEKSHVQPVLEAAAQQILAHPELAGEGSLALEDLPDSPTVDIELAEVELPDGSLGRQSGGLYHVELSYKGSHLEFSLLIPQSDFQ